MNVTSGAIAANEDRNYALAFTDGYFLSDRSQRPMGTVQEWNEYRDHITEHEAWGRVKNSRLGATSRSPPASGETSICGLDGESPIIFVS